MANQTGTAASRDLAGAFLEFFYPINYQVGKALEDVMRDGRLSRKQVVMLWILRSEGGPEGRMLRKDLQHLIEGWFEISSPAMSQALRAMARPPLSLVRLAEAPDSGREQLVRLTAKGERFLAKMADNGKRLLEPMLAVLPAKDLRTLLRLYERHLPIAIQQLHGEVAPSE